MGLSSHVGGKTIAPISRIKKIVSTIDGPSRERPLPELLPEPDGTPPATFVVLHRGGDDGAYLNAYSWVWDNVLHFKGASAGQPVLGCPDRDPSHFITPDLPWIGCVWELPPILHERDAWVRHLLAPEVPDLDAYLADSLPEGTTGDRT
jgi:hypothetical protein